MEVTVVSLAKQLIARRSITPNDAGCLDLLQDRLRPLGFNCERITSGGVENLWARRGVGRPLLCFAGHTDVVPTGPIDKWTADPFFPTVRGGALYGRGASDMKSSLAAFVVACEEFVQRHAAHAGSIAFLLTSDEEGPAVDGTVRVCEMLAARGEKIDYCLIGEPTCVTTLGDTIKNGRRGSLSGVLRVRGIQSHIAYPHLGDNPVHRVAPALAELAQTQWDSGNEYFPPTTWQISNFHAGTGADNVVPGEATIRFNFRFSTASTVESLRERVEQILNRHHVAYDLQWIYSGKPYLTAQGELVAATTRAIKEVTGVDTVLSTSGGTSDGRYISEICPQVVEFGPTNASIHKIDECISLEELERLPRVYRKVMENLLL